MSDRNKHGAWAVRHWRQGIYIDTVRRTRREAIEAFREQFNFSDDELAAMLRYGVNKAVRVVVSMEKPND